MEVRISEKHKLAVIDYSPEVARLIPHSKVYEKFLLVPAQKEELQLLRNLGYTTPSALSINYDWCGVVPFRAQMVTAEMLIHSPRAFVLNEMGTGKTLAALFAYDFLRKQGVVRSMLILAPLSTLTAVWEREIFIRMPHLKVRMLWSQTANKRREALRDDADIYIINHDGAKTIHKELLAKRGIDVLLIDELAVFRNRSTARWKVVQSLTHDKRFVWGMTGSPIPRQPSDAWAQIRLVNPEKTTPYFKQFQERVMRQVSQFTWVPKHDANDVVFTQMQPAVRFTRAECVDLPPTTWSTRTVNFTPEQTKVYQELLNHNHALYNAGEITAANAAVVVGKLLQVGCGFAYATDGTPITMPCSPRLSLLEDIIDECSNKLIVFAPFVQAVDLLYNHLKALGHDVGRIYGGTGKRERDETFQTFQHSRGMKVLVAHPQTMAHGLTLTAADTVVWYSPTHSAEIYEQANARITRPGQVHHTHIINIEGSPLEAKVFARIRRRLNTQAALLELFGEMDAKNA